MHVCDSRMNIVVSVTIETGFDESINNSGTPANTGEYHLFQRPIIVATRPTMSVRVKVKRRTQWMQCKVEACFVIFVITLYNR